VSSPEEAIERARAAAAERREAGEYPASETGIEPLPDGAPTYSRLLEWALIDPDLGQVRSTRRWGAPITGVKRALLRLLSQYHAELIAEQARFNANLVRYVGELEQRVRELERERDR
jgi:hypothetical protein